MNKFMRVGVIQTSLNHEAAWVPNKGGNWKDTVRISATEERRAKKEIRHFFNALDGADDKPDVILLPELSVPIGFEKRLKGLAESIESIVIAGMDYKIEKSASHPTVSNEAVIIVPHRLKGKKIAKKTDLRRIGKTYPAPAERKKLDGIIKGGVSFLANPTIWQFRSEAFGNFGVAVCYDFMDLDRIVLYRGKIQTLFILAYNKDTNSFDHVAEAIARTVFCNVVICNCGHFGGSFAVSPYKETFRRTIYKSVGQKLANAQIVSLPIKKLHSHQNGNPKTAETFKSLPPGFTDAVSLTTKSHKIPAKKK